MQLPTVPTFDGVLTAGLGAIGVPAIAIFLVVTAFAVKSWIDGARQVNKGVVATGRGLRWLWATVRQMPGAQLIGTIAVTILVPCSQLLLLEFCYIIGNFLSTLVGSLVGHNSRAGFFTQALSHPLQPIAILTGGLRMDLLSGAYLLFGAGCIVSSYWLAFRRSQPDFPGRLLALPATLLGRLGSRIWISVGVLVIIGVVLNAGDHAPIPSLFTGILGFSIIVVPLATVFYAACVAGVRASRMLVETWSPSPPPPPSPYGPTPKPTVKERIKPYLFWVEDFDNRRPGPFGIYI